jgi:hypothetical protein
MFQLNLMQLHEFYRSCHINLLDMKPAVWQTATNLSKECTPSTFTHPWRWGYYVSPERWYLWTKGCGVISQNT